MQDKARLNFHACAAVLGNCARIMLLKRCSQRGCMHVISFEFPRRRITSPASVILQPRKTLFPSHYVLNLIPFYSRCDSRRRENNNERRNKCGRSGDGSQLKDCHTRRGKTTEFIGSVSVTDRPRMLISFRDELWAFKTCDATFGLF